MSGTHRYHQSRGTSSRLASTRSHEPLIGGSLASRAISPVHAEPHQSGPLSLQSGVRDPFENAIKSYYWPYKLEEGEVNAIKTLRDVHECKVEYPTTVNPHRNWSVSKSRLELTFPHPLHDACDSQLPRFFSVCTDIFGGTNFLGARRVPLPLGQ